VVVVVVASLLLLWALLVAQSLVAASHASGVAYNFSS